MVVFDPEAGSPEFLILESHCRVCPHRQDIGLWAIIHSRKVAAHDARFKEGCHCITLCYSTIKFYLGHYVVLPCFRVNTDSRAVGEIKELCEFRYGDEIFLNGTASDPTSLPFENRDVHKYDLPCQHTA